MSKDPRVRRGDVVIRRKPDTSVCDTVLVLTDNVLPDDHWLPRAYPEALTFARRMTAQAWGRIWIIEADGTWSEAQ